MNRYKVRIEVGRNPVDHLDTPIGAVIVEVEAWNQNSAEKLAVGLCDSGLADYFVIDSQVEEVNG